MKEQTNNKLSFDLLQLQNRIKRDPPSYYDEFHLQYTHFQSLLELYKMKPQDYNDNFADLVMFFAQVSTCYKEDLAEYPALLMNILKEYYTVMDASLRMCLCKALILMRNRNFISSIDLTPLLFFLLRCKDKLLRKYLQLHIITDIKNINSKHRDTKVNSALQNFMFKMLSDNNATAAKISLDILIDLYRRHIWRDVKTVNAITTACFSKVNKILVAAHNFFLGVDEEEKVDNKDSSDSEEDNKPDVKDVMMVSRINKKTRKRLRNLKRARQLIKSSKKKKNKEFFDFSAVHLIHDPQGMAEKLLKMLGERNERYEIKLLVMNLISRLIGVHELILLSFYSYLIRLLKPHQRDVTKILMYAAQAAHQYVPPDDIEPVVKTIANNFITERNSDECMTVGINAIREICLRCPFAISQDLLQDIVQYQKYRNKNVSIAAKSLVHLYRKINPQMLQRKYRCRPTEAMKEWDVMEYGALTAKSYIPGSECLTVEPPKDDGTEEADVEEEDNDDSWIDIPHSDNELDENESGVDEEDTTECSSVHLAGSNLSCKGRRDGKKNSVKRKTSENEDVTETDQNKMETNSANKSPKETLIDKKEKATIISQSRILTQEEFKKLRAAQLSKEMTFTSSKKRKAEIEDLEESLRNRGELVSLRDIEKLHKKPKSDKDSRLATVQEGREGREKYGRKKKKSPHSSKTHKENKKNKAFMMIKYKVRSKIKRSFRDKQISLRKSLLKRKRNK